MGWDCIASKNGVSILDFKLTQRNITIAIQEAINDFVNASKEVTARCGYVDVGLINATLDVDTCGEILQELTGLSMWETGREIMPDELLIYNDIDWEAYLVVNQNKLSNKQWKVSFYSVRAFWELIIKHELSIIFSA